MFGRKVAVNYGFSVKEIGHYLTDTTGFLVKSIKSIHRILVDCASV
jgi:hypothetical protein